MIFACSFCWCSKVRTETIYLALFTHDFHRFHYFTMHKRICQFLSNAHCQRHTVNPILCISISKRHLEFHSAKWICVVSVCMLFFWCHTSVIEKKPTFTEEKFMILWIGVSPWKLNSCSGCMYQSLTLATYDTNTEPNDKLKITYKLFRIVNLTPYYDNSSIRLFSVFTQQKDSKRIFVVLKLMSIRKFDQKIKFNGDKTNWRKKRIFLGFAELRFQLLFLILSLFHFIQVSGIRSYWFFFIKASIVTIVFFGNWFRLEHKTSTPAGVWKSKI